VPEDNRTSRGALAYWFDIAPEVTGEWLQWYLHDHMPSRVGTVFVTGRCYERIAGEASHMVLFETATPEDLLGPAYLALLGNVSEEDRQRRGWYSNTVRVTCRVAGRSGRGIGGVLGVIRIRVDGSRLDQVRLGLQNDVLPKITSGERIGSVWVLENDKELRARMDAARVTGHQDGSADFAVLIEAGHDEDLAAVMDGVGQMDAWRALGLSETSVFERYRLLYTMTQADDV